VIDCTFYVNQARLTFPPNVLHVVTQSSPNSPNVPQLFPKCPQVETLLKLFPTVEFRNVALQCLTEVASLNIGQFYDAHFTELYTIFITRLQMVRSRAMCQCFNAHPGVVRQRLTSPLVDSLLGWLIHKSIG
jgi:hypothetical protein